jgi:hypothetical protein
VFYLTNILLHVIGKDKATLVDSGCLPADGLAELRPLCLTAFQRIKADVARAGVTEALYYEVIGLCTAAMYVFVPQGRIQGVRSMTMAMASSLFGDGRSYTSDFKTEAIYLFQPVLGTPEVKVH